ncbi:hypothetical protein RSAG8_00012, partial [Rhizoctonia solani AG-8 WAC10335]
MERERTEEYPSGFRSTTPEAWRSPVLGKVAHSTWEKMTLAREWKDTPAKRSVNYDDVKAVTEEVNPDHEVDFPELVAIYCLGDPFGQQQAPGIKSFNMSV